MVKVFSNGVYRNGVIDMIAVKILIDVLEKSYDVPSEHIGSRNKSRRYSMARAMFVRLMRDTFKLSFTSIAPVIGRTKQDATYLYKLHDKFYVLNYEGYKWDFHEIATEFKGRYYNEAGRNA